ncbi:hypothetical protein CSUI_002838 [Cystoisospora suis]|uniref:Uncharacterized protein n=1 Tax=Cystoisospora suis TaxID=483139 RepID=A0A2C6L6L0_9APIC|nr:hypothetical protein CSUI_002838 [Cystoisospora suis]
MGLDGAERHDLLITVHELLAYLEVVERFRQKAVEDSSRLRQYCTELGCMLKQANEREERGHREVEKQRNFLLTCQAQIQALKNTTDTAMNELRTQRDMLAERLNVTTVELEHALKENERLLLEREAQEIAVRDGQNVRKAYAFLEEEKKQLQNEVEALRVELSKAQSERNSLLAEMHALRDRALLSPHLFENQEQPLQLQQEEEERERQRGEEEKDNREKNEEEEGWQRDTRDGREGHGGEEEEDGEFEVLVEELFLTSRDRSEKKYKTTEDPHDDERNQERKRREKVDKILAIYKNLREEKNEYHGYAVELLNRLDSATSSSHTNEEFQGGSSSSSPSGQHLSDAMMHATRSQANGLLHSSSSSSSPSPSSSICRNTTGSQRNLSNDVCSPSSSSSLSSSTSSFSRDTQSRQRTAREGERDEEFLSRHPYHAGSPLPSSSCSFTPSSSSSTPCVSAASSSSSSNFPCEEKRKKSQKESGEKEDKDEEEHTRLNGLPLDVCMVESEGMSQAT